MKKERDLTAIAGSTLIYRVRITKNGGRMPFLAACKVQFLISRYNSSAAVIRQSGVFGASEQNFKITIPSTQTRSLSGNYVYHVKVTTPYGNEIVKNYGHMFVHGFIGG